MIDRARSTAVKRFNKAQLLSIARTVASELRNRSSGTALRIRQPGRVTATNTDGWAAKIGDLGEGKPRLEIWADRFSGHQDRKLWACLSGTPSQLSNLTERVKKKLVPVRIIRESDGTDGRFFILNTPLNRREFNAPILEKYIKGEGYFSICDSTPVSSERATANFTRHAAAFFESVARALPRAKPEDDTQEAYPRFENRSVVVSHLRRERSRLLATQCKIRDRHCCQVCGHCFENLYGKIGRDYAEAHHLVPLSQLRANVTTRLKDLITVCSNCHRMLHRMSGNPTDVRRLRSIVRRHRNEGT